MEFLYILKYVSKILHMSTSSKTAQATLALRHIRTGRGEEVEARIAGPGGRDLRFLVGIIPS